MAKISQNKIINVLTEDWGKDERNGLPYSGNGRIIISGNEAWCECY